LRSLRRFCSQLHVENPKLATNYDERHFLREMRKRNDVHEARTQVEHVQSLNFRRSQREYASVGNLQDYNDLLRSKSAHEASAIWRKSQNNVAMTSAAISKIAKLGAPDLALGIFEEFKASNSTPNQCTYGSVIAVCSWAQRFSTAELYCREMVAHGFKLDSVILTSLMRLYMYQYPNRAVELFEMHKDRMLEGGEIIPLTLALGVYKRAGLLHDLEKLYTRLCSLGFKLSPAQLVPVLWMYGQKGDFQKATSLWQGIKTSDEFTENRFIFETYAQVLALKGAKQELLELKLEMERMDLRPSRVFLGSWLDCLWRNEDFDLGDKEFDHAVKANLVDLEHYSTCSNVGSLKKEERVDFHDCSIGMAAFGLRYVLRNLLCLWESGEREFANYPLKLQTGNGLVLEKLCEEVKKIPGWRYKYILNSNKMRIGITIYEECLKNWLKKSV